MTRSRAVIPGRFNTPSRQLEGRCIRNLLGVTRTRAVYRGEEGEDRKLDSSADGEDSGLMMSETSWNGAWMSDSKVLMTASACATYQMCEQLQHLRKE